MSRADLHDPTRSLWNAPPPPDVAAQLPEPDPNPDAARTAALLDGVLSGVGGPAIVLDAHGHIERINRRAAQQTGLRLGEPLLERLVKAGRVRASIEDEIAGGQRVAFVASPGIEWRTVPIRDAEGALVGTAVFADI